MHRSLRILCSTLLVAGGLVVAVPADAAAKPSSTLVAVTKKVNANTAPKFGVAFAHLPSGSTSYLQRQYGTKRVWKNVVKVAQKKQTVTAPKVPMGKLGYRLITVRKGKTVAVSNGVVVYSYGKISLTALCGGLEGGTCETDTRQVGSTIFTYQMTTGSYRYSDYFQAAHLNKTSCRAVSLRFASLNYSDDQSAYLQIVQAASDPQYAQVGPQALGTMKAKLDGGAFYLNVASSEGNSVMFAGSASCWSIDGTR